VKTKTIFFETFFFLLPLKLPVCSLHTLLLIHHTICETQIDYIHFNPVEAGFVNQPQDWRLSSASEDSPVKNR